MDHKQYADNGLRTDNEAVGSGPYKLESFGEDEAVFSVNESYKGTAKVKNSGVTLKFFHGDQAALKTAIENNEIDIAYRGLAADDIADIENDTATGTGVNVVEGTSAEVQHLVFNMDDPVAGQLSVRKAIAYLLDRQALVDEVYQDTATPLYSIIPAGIAGHNTAFFDTYGASPSRSKAQAALRADGITDKVKLTLWSTPSRYGPSTDQEFKAIAKQLNASGLFEATVKSVAFDEYEQDIADGKYGVYVKGWVPDYPDPDNFTAPFFGEGNVLSNNYTNSTITGRLHPGHRRREQPRLDRGRLRQAPGHRGRRTADHPALAGQAVRRRPRQRLRPGVLPRRLDRLPLLGDQQGLTPAPRTQRAAPSSRRKGPPSALLYGSTALCGSTARRGAPTRSRTRTPPPAPGRAAPTW